MATFFPINTPLVNYFFYPAPLTQNGPNVPIAGGFLFFFDNDDHTVQLPTYSDVSDIENPVANTNPIELGLAGECPLFYLKDQSYYVVITGPDGDLQNPIWTIDNYNPGQVSTQEENALNTNILVNSQFTFPLLFSEGDPEIGLIDPLTPQTAVAWGWSFFQDNPTTTVNKVTFNLIAQEQVEGAPIREIVLNSSNPMTNEQTKQFRQLIGPVNFLADQQVTFAAQFQNLLSGTAFITIIIEQNFGGGGSEPVMTSYGPITITDTRDEAILLLNIPSIAGKTLQYGNYIAIHVQGQLGQVCHWSMTNAHLEKGDVPDPVYQALPFADEVAAILGEATQIEPPIGLLQNYSPMTYVNGAVAPMPQTGQIVLYPLEAKVPPYLKECDGDPLIVSDYTNNIPNHRLYSVIGQTFGGTGGLIVTSTNNNVIFKSGVGAIENSAYSAGTTGFTVTNTVPGLWRGVNAALQSSTSVRLTWTDDFAPVQTPPGLIPLGWDVPTSLIGNWFITGGTEGAAPIKINVIDAGSGVTPAIADVVFQSSNPADYKLNGKAAVFTAGNSVQVTYNFLEWATFENNSRGTYYPTNNLTSLVYFSYNGQVTMPLSIQGDHGNVVVPLVSGDTISTIMQKFITLVANPFTWTVTVNNTPSAGQYFLFSAPGAGNDFGAWYKVDGNGTEPVTPTPAGGWTEIAISSSDNTTVVAQKTAAALNSLTFNVPAPAELPTIPGTPLVGWFINL